MAICLFCNQNMSDRKIHSCDGNHFVKFPDGSKLPAIVYDAPFSRRCHDCNVSGMGYHHPGCDMERCPKCGGQLISCGCLDEQYEEEDE